MYICLQCIHIHIVTYCAVHGCSAQWLLCMNIKYMYRSTQCESTCTAKVAYKCLCSTIENSICMHIHVQSIIIDIYGAYCTHLYHMKAPICIGDLCWHTCQLYIWCTCHSDNYNNAMRLLPWEYILLVSCHNAYIALKCMCFYMLYFWPYYWPDQC